jgi:hypothetical protein
MMKVKVYWAIAQSTKYPDIYVKRIEALSNTEAVEKAEAWYKNDIGFVYSYVLTKEIPKN